METPPKDVYDMAGLEPIFTFVTYPVNHMRSRFLIVIGSLALVLAACGSGQTDLMTYTDPANLSLVNVPAGWNAYQLDELSALGDLPFTESFQQFEFPSVSSIAFDAAPARDVTNVTSSLAAADYPIGSMSVRTVGDVEKEFLSRATLSQSVVPYYQYVEPTEHVKEDFSFGDGFDGVRVLVSFADSEGSGVGVAYLISVTDPADQRMFSIVVGCSRDCFIQNQQLIEQVVDSWLVNKKTS
jgi:hypothetical protein